MSGDKLWWYSNGEDRNGPYTEGELKRIAASGQLAQDGLVWKVGLDSWAPAASIPGLLPTLPATAADAASAGEAAPPPYFAVSPGKLLVMTLCTFTFYELYWFYQNWWRIKQRDRSDISPFWRTFFSVFYCYALLRRIDESARGAGLAPQYRAGPLAAGWIVLTLLWKLPDPYWLISYLAILFLLPAQQLANRVNAQEAPDHDRNERYSGWNIAAIVGGGLLLVMAVFGSFIAEENEPAEKRSRPTRSAPVA